MLLLEQMQLESQEVEGIHIASYRYFGAALNKHQALRSPLRKKALAGVRAFGAHRGVQGFHHNRLRAVFLCLVKKFQRYAIDTALALR